MNKDSFPASFPVNINRDGWGCFLTVPLSIAVICWLAFISYMWLSTQSLQSDMIFNISMGVAALFGLIGWVIGVRSQYTEKIEITATSITYFQKGWLRRTKQWYEPLTRYKGIATKLDTGIASSGVDTVSDIDIFLVILQHERNKKRNVVLEKNADNKVSQLKIQENYAKLLKLPALI